MLKNMRYRKTLLLLLISFLSFNCLAQMPDTEIFLVKYKKKGGKFIFSKAQNITNRDGYDNQPSFSPDGSYILYTSYRPNKQADIYKYDIYTNATTQVTNTPEDEYSPTFMPYGNSISVVRVEKDSSQRLWRFPLDGGKPERILPRLDSVGYHCWISPTLVAYVKITNPASLRVGYTIRDTSFQRCSHAGRCVLPVPNKKFTFSFVDETRKGDTNNRIFTLDWKDNIKMITPVIYGSEDYAWLPDGSIIMGSEGKLFRFKPGKDKKWNQIADFSAETGRFYRIAASPKGNAIAIVAYKGKKP